MAIALGIGLLLLIIIFMAAEAIIGSLPPVRRLRTIVNSFNDTSVRFREIPRHLLDEDGFIHINTLRHLTVSVVLEAKGGTLPQDNKSFGHWITIVHSLGLFIETGAREIRHYSFSIILISIILFSAIFLFDSTVQAIWQVKGFLCALEEAARLAVARHIVPVLEIAGLVISFIYIHRLTVSINEFIA